VIHFVTSTKLLPPPVSSRYRLKTSLPCRETKLSPLAKREEALKGSRNARSKTSAKRELFYDHVIDLTDDKVFRKVRKHCYRTHASKYLEHGRDPKLDPEVQAAYQAATPNILKLKELRDLALKRIQSGSVSWKHCFQRISNIEKSILNRKFYRTYFVNVIEYRYAHWCIAELQLIIDRLYGIFGFTIDSLSFCAKHKKENLSIVSKGFRKEVKRLIIESNRV